MNEVFNRIQLLCNQEQISITELSKRINVDGSTILKWKKTTPKTDSLVPVANYFHVSIDYLMGRTDVKETADNVLSNTEIQTIQRAMSKMSDVKQDNMMTVLKAAFGEYFNEDVEND